MCILYLTAVVSLVTESSRQRQQTNWLNFHALLQVPDFVNIKESRVPVAARENNRFLDIVYIYYTLLLRLLRRRWRRRRRRLRGVLLLEMSRVY